MRWLYHNTYLHIFNILERSKQHRKRMARAARVAILLGLGEGDVTHIPDEPTVTQLLETLHIPEKWQNTDLLFNIVTSLREDQKRLAVDLLERYESYLYFYNKAVKLKDSPIEIAAAPEVSKAQVQLEVTVATDLHKISCMECKELVFLLLSKACKIPRNKIAVDAFWSGESTTIAFIIAKAYLQKIIQRSVEGNSVWAFKELSVTRVRIPDLFEVNVTELLTQLFKEALHSGLTGDMDFVCATKALPYQVYALVDLDRTERLLVRTIHHEIVRPWPELSRRRQGKEMVEWESGLHKQSICKEEQKKEENKQLEKQLAEECRNHEEEIKRIKEERGKQLEEEERRKQCKRYVTSGNILIDMANSLATHRQNCPALLLPAANEIDMLIAEYVAATVGTSSGIIAGAVSSLVLAALAPFTFGITGVIAAGTGAATLAIAAGKGVGASKVREKIENATDARFRAQEWIREDKELCSDMLGGVIAYEESWNEMTKMFNEETSMHAYLQRQGVAQSSKVQKRFTQLSASVVKKWRAQKFDLQNATALRVGKAQARSTVHQFIHYPNRQQDFSTITLFFDYPGIADMLLEYAKEKNKVPPVQQLIEKIVSDLKADAKRIQHFSELKSMDYPRS